jgi:GNAT superfamily N-acetyltransferase
MRDHFAVRVAEGPGDLVAVRELWREYWKSFGLSDQFQGFGEELNGLPGVYGSDGGVLLVAWSEDTVAGTIALRRLNDRAGEVKRLYLRPEFRGRGLGRRLIDEVVNRARQFGYQVLYADTLPVMRDALSLYAKMGFENVDAYSSQPTPGAVFLRLRLA